MESKHQKIKTSEGIVDSFVLFSVFSCSYVTGLNVSLGRPGLGGSSKWRGKCLNQNTHIQTRMDTETKWIPFSLCHQKYKSDHN